MCLTLPVPVSTNYTRGWNSTEMELETIIKRTEQGATLSEVISPKDIIKPYVDIDRKVPHTVFAEENEKTLAYWTDALSPLCSEDNLTGIDSEEEELIQKGFMSRKKK